MHGAEEGTTGHELSKGMRINIAERDPERLRRAARSTRLGGRRLKISPLLLLAQNADDEGDGDRQNHGQKRDQKAPDQTPAPAAAPTTRSDSPPGIQAR